MATDIHHDYMRRAFGLSLANAGAAGPGDGHAAQGRRSGLMDLDYWLGQAQTAIATIGVEAAAKPLAARLATLRKGREAAAAANSSIDNAALTKLGMAAEQLGKDAAKARDGAKALARDHAQLSQSLTAIQLLVAEFGQPDPHAPDAGQIAKLHERLPALEAEFADLKTLPLDQQARGVEVMHGSFSALLAIAQQVKTARAAPAEKAAPAGHHHHHRHHHHHGHDAEGATARSPHAA